MLEASLPSSILRRVFEALRELITEANIEFSPDGMELQAIDSAHVTLIHLWIGTEGFQTYRCDSSRTVGVKINDFLRILKTGGNDDMLTIRHGSSPAAAVPAVKSEFGESQMSHPIGSEANSDSLLMCFENAEGNRSSEFRYKLITIETECLAIPATEFDCCIDMRSKELLRVFTDISTLGDTTNIDVCKTHLAISTKGDGIDGRVILPVSPSLDSGNVRSIRCDAPLSLPYASKYLLIFSKAASVSDFVKLHMSAQLPIKVEYKLEAGHICYYLAPKCD